MREVTILQICVEGNTGSTGRIAESLGNLIIEKKWRSIIAFGRFGRPSSSELIRIGTTFDLIIHGVLTRLFDKHGLGSRASTKKLITKIEKIKPNLILLHHLHGYYINIQILFNFLAKSRIPVVWIFHDCWAITGHCVHFDNIGCSKWKKVCYNCPQIHKYPKSYLFDRSTKNFVLKKKLFLSINNLTIISVSRWLKTVISESFLSNVPNTIIHNGIDTDVFSHKPCLVEVRRIHGLESKFILLGVASHWRENKGLKFFKLLSNHIDKETAIILIGLNKYESKNLPPNIIGLPRTENQLILRDYYIAADLFLNLSVEESFGLTTAESLSCGTPALVFNTTANPEIVDDNTGFMVEKGDINGIVKAINKVRSCGKSSYSDACLSRAIKLFNKDLQYAKYIEVFSNIISKTRI